MENMDKSQKTGVARWLPLIIPAVLIVILLPVAVYIGFNTGEDNETSDPVTTPEAEAQTTPVAGAVEVTNFAFVPNEITAAPGSTLTFHNTSNTEHRIQVGDGEAYVLAAGETWEWDATEAGTYDLLCTVHPNEMTGEVVVS